MKKLLGVTLGGIAALLIVLYALKKNDAPAPANAAASAQTQSAQVSPQAAAQNATPSLAAAAAPNDGATCERLASLCETSDQKVDVGECKRKMGDARKVSGDGNVDRAGICIAEAKTCAAASGCVSGTVGLGAVGEFLKGIGSALSH